MIRRIVTAIAPRPEQCLVEIGPGQGAITLPLLKAAGRLQVIEMDRDLVGPLADRCAPAGELIVHNQDALRTDFCALRNGHARIRVVGNLPYNISTPLLFHLLAQAGCIEDMHFMLQREVVDRMCAAPASRARGRLSVMVQYHCRPERLFGIGPGAFRPPPRVESAFVRLLPHRTPPVAVDDYRTFEALVRQAFSHRRKTLANALKGLLTATQIEAAGVDPGARAERLDLAAFAALANGAYRVASGEE